MRSPLRPRISLCFAVFVLLSTLGQQSVFAASTTTKAAANLDQCRNGASTAPIACSGGAWVNGNAGASNAHYVEGDSISYRMVMTGLSLGTHTLIIQWDTTKGGTHALDYITSWDRTAAAGSDACGDLLSASICSAGTPFAIDLTKDSAVPALLPKTSPVRENMMAYGGTITSIVFAMTPPANFSFVGDTSQTATITFTATNSTMVLAWGGHIAKRQEWGAPIVSNTIPFSGTASNISGSPYHTRLVSIDGAGGNQDRSLSAAAVASTSQVTITKSVTTSGSGSFTFSATPSPLSTFTLNSASSPTMTFANITNFTSYTVGEQIPSGWKIDTTAAGGGIDCSLSNISLDYGTNIFSKTLGPGGSSGSVVIALGEGDDATCTFYDAETSATLTVIKNVVNSHGGNKVASDFSITVTATNPSPATFNGSETGTTVVLGAGSYSVAEGAHTGYDVSYSTDCIGSISGGGSKTCTITNTDVAPTLHVIKVVNNTHGGTKGPADFSITVTGSSPSPSTFAGSSLGTSVTLGAGSYSVAEGSHTGYSVSYSADCTGSIAVGDDKTCTITNSDIAPVLHVIKNVVNNHGGTKGPADFSITVTGTSPSPSTFAGSSSGTAVTLTAGSYSVAEGTHSGYEVSYSTDCSGTLAIGDDKTCTITNTDIAPVLHVVKNVVNSHGGTKSPGDFSITVTGTNPSPSTFAGSSLGTDVTLAAGTYSVAEGSHTGYSVSYSTDCTGSVAVGDSKTCTITNTDLAPTLHVVKVVSNAHGGTKGPADFSISVKSGETNVPGSPHVGASSPGTSYTLSAGTYVVSELSVTGYQFVSFSGACDATGTVNLNLGDDVTCTITNADIAPILKVVKTVTNTHGGGALPSNFSIHVKSGLVDVGSSPQPGAISPGTAYSLSAGSYSVSEDAVIGYQLVSITGDCSSLGTITLAVGDIKTCTLNNADLAPNLTIVKTPDVTGDTGYLVSPGGTATFTITVTNTGSGNANNVLITDTLPSGVGAWTSDQTTACTITTNTSLSCSLSGLAPGASFIVNLTATVPSDYLLPPILPPGSSTFEIDGDLIAGTAAKDWSNIGIDCNSTPKKGCDVDLPSGATDNSFGQGTKEDTAVPTVVAGSVPNNKSDLTRFYVATEKVSGTDFLYLAWERVQAPKGTTNMDFELNQSSQLSSNNVTPVRTAGDILINYDLESGGTVPTLGYRVWITAASAGGETAADLCDSNTSFPCWGKVQQLSNHVAGAVNSVGVTDPILAGSQVSSRSLDPLTFGEASINLQAAGIFPVSITNVSQCTSFGQAYLKSRASSTFNTEIKDFIKPISITVANCPPKLLDNTAFASASNNPQVSDTGEIEVR